MKKLVNLLAIFSLIVSMGVSVSAAENDLPMERTVVDGVDITIDIEEEISRAKMGITDIDIPAPVAISGDIDDVQIYTTTRKIDQAKSCNEQMYATTTVAVMPLSDEKSETNSENDYYVTAYGTLYWRDNLGTKNDFLGASGGWDCDTNPETKKKPTLSGRTVKLEAGTNARDGVKKTFNYSSNSFEIAQSEFNYSKLFLTMRTYVTVDSTKKLELYVSPGLVN